ncbi:MAG: hypothetical protein PHU14_12050, partial [Methylovulum sp.]|nr:hypothetical protein [Methylovulum sp.]
MNNYKCYTFLCAALLVFTSANAVRAADTPLVTIGYTKHYGSSLDEQLTGITHDSLGNAVIVGNSVDSSASTYSIKGFVRKYDALGALLWRRDRALASTDGVTTDKND